MVIPDILAFTMSGITGIIAISDISTSTIGRSKKCKKCTQKNKKKPQKIEDKCTPKIFIIKHINNSSKMHPKNTKKGKKHTEIAKITPKMPKNDISGIADVLPGFSPYWLSPITSFYHIGDNRYYRDILESVPTLSTQHACWWSKMFVHFRGIVRHAKTVTTCMFVFFTCT